MTRRQFSLLPLGSLGASAHRAQSGAAPVRPNVLWIFGDPDQETIVQPLKDAGYHTAYFGKWHLDGFKEAQGRSAMHIVPPERRCGFDVWAGYDNNNSQWDSWVHGGEVPWYEGCLNGRFPVLLNLADTGP